MSLGFTPTALTSIAAQNIATMSKTPEQHAQTAAKLAREAKTPEDLQRAKNVLEMAATRKAMEAKKGPSKLVVGLAAAALLLGIGLLVIRQS